MSAAGNAPAIGAGERLRAGRPGGKEIRIIAIGASTGGTEAIKRVLAGLPPGLPGIVISQHIPAHFIDAFAERLETSSSVRVCEARHRQIIEPGHAYIAPGGKHLRVRRIGERFQCRLDDGPAVRGHKPSVDVMFRSVAEQAGAEAIGVLLTGMGDDGAEGIGQMRRAGAVTIAQDEASSVVWGMPGEAVRRGHIAHVLQPPMIAAKLRRLVSPTPRGA